MRRQALPLLIAMGLLVSGSACVKKNEDKLSLQKLLQASSHSSGVFRYSDRTPTSPFDKGSLVQVRGLVEDDFRYKARLSVDSEDAIDEVVNDDALAVRFLNPSFVSKFTSSQGGDVDVRAALAARYWVTDASGAPSIGDAAVTDRVIGVDPIVDSLSVIDYTIDAVSAAAGVFKWNAERLDYRPAEDPFPRPAKGSGVTRWDLAVPPLPKADAVETGSANASLARVQNFREMAIYVKNGRVVQIREQLGAKFDLLNKFSNYMVQFIRQGSEKAADAFEEQLDTVKNQPELRAAILNFALNQALLASGEEPVRFRTMVYEFTRGAGVRADLPFGPEVREGSLAFFGVNSKTNAEDGRQVSGQVVGSGGSSPTTAVGSDDTTTATTTAP